MSNANLGRSINMNNIELMRHNKQTHNHWMHDIDMLHHYTTNKALAVLGQGRQHAHWEARVSGLAMEPSRRRLFRKGP